MDTQGIATGDPSAAEDRMVQLARELTVQRGEPGSFPEEAGRIAAGLGMLSDLARESGQIRIAKACKTLSAILLRTGKGQEEDAAFILSTALNFLDAIQAKRVSGAGRQA